jgi:hypothetical protein
LASSENISPVVRVLLWERIISSFRVLPRESRLLMLLFDVPDEVLIEGLEKLELIDELPRDAGLRP